MAISPTRKYPKKAIKNAQLNKTDNTWLTYRNVFSSFQKFRQNHGLNNVWPCPITHIVNYVAFMFKQGYSPSTIKAYLSGVNTRKRQLKMHN
jgi:site-specific recombinase XerD